MQSFESLERRALLSATFTFANGVLTVNGTPGNDNFYVTIGAGSLLHVIDNGQSVASHPVSKVKKLVFLGGDGNDNFSINGSLGPVHAHLIGGNGDDRLSSGVGNDTIDGGAGRDWLNGSDGNDSMIGGTENDVVSGDKGNDTIFGGDHDDLCTGGEGNDFIDAGFGKDILRGGIGIDTASYATRTNPVFVDISGETFETADDGEAGEKDFVQYDMENLIGGAGNDLLIGTRVSADKVTAPGFTRNNILRGNAGNDTLQGLDGNDILDGGLGTDSLAGGTGIDTADYSGRIDRLILNLDGSANDGAVGERDRIVADIENIVGGQNHDRITGNAKNNVLKGGAGNDMIDGGLGADYIYGGAGSDTAYYANRTENLVLNLDGIANDGAASEKDLIATDMENVTGGLGADRITGDARNNILRGNAGNDTIYAGNGNDIIYGDAGANSLYGEGGNDSLFARTAPAIKDIVDGGAGSDKAQVDALDPKTSIESLLV